VLRQDPRQAPRWFPRQATATMATPKKKAHRKTGAYHAHTPANTSADTDEDVYDCLWLRLRLHQL